MEHKILPFALCFFFKAVITSSTAELSEVLGKVRAAVNLSEWSFDWIIGVAAYQLMHLRAARGRAPTDQRSVAATTGVVDIVVCNPIHPSIPSVESRASERASAR